MLMERAGHKATVSPAEFSDPQEKPATHFASRRCNRGGNRSFTKRVKDRWPGRNEMEAIGNSARFVLIAQPSGLGRRAKPNPTILVMVFDKFSRLRALIRS
jgi:hypothetical protein